MKKFKSLLLSAALVLPVVTLQSCLDDDDDNTKIYPSAEVTVRPQADGSFMMVLDPSTVLKPVNVDKSPFGDKIVRALVNYELSEAPQTPAPDINSIKTQYVKINWIDSIRTKQLAPDLGEENVLEYGNSPLEIVNDWVTVAEDGYLTLRVRVQSTGTRKHGLNLVWTPTEEDYLNFTLYHDDNGDHGNRITDAMIAFDLMPVVGELNCNPTIRVNWKSANGDRSALFKMAMYPIYDE